MQEYWSQNSLGEYNLRLSPVRLNITLAYFFVKVLAKIQLTISDLIYRDHRIFHFDWVANVLLKSCIKPIFAG